MEWRCFSFMSIFTKHLECDYSVMCDWKPLLLLFCPSSSLPLLLLWLSPEQKNCMSHINCARKKARVNNPCHISTRIWVTWCYLKRGGIYTSNFCLLILGLPWAVASAQTIAMAAACCSLSLSFFLSASIAALILSWRKGLHEVNFSIQNIQNKCKPHAGSSSIPNEQYSALISTVLATRTLSIVKASSSLSLVFLLSASSAASILSWTKRLHDQKSHRNPKHQKQSRAYMEIQRPPRVCSCPNN